MTVQHDGSTSTASTTNKLTEEKDNVQRCIDRVKKCGIKVCVFDMDQTAVADHSRGRLTREGLDDYVSKATEGFLSLVPALAKAGIGLAIATHSDEEEFGGDIRPETHILGSELAQALIDKHFSENNHDNNEPLPPIFSKIVAYNPRARHGKKEKENLYKRYHMRVLLNHFQVQPKELLFFDDATDIIQDCNNFCGVRAIQVHPDVGFQLEDLLDNL